MSSNAVPMRFMRFVTAALVMAACGWTAAQGLDFVRFQSALDKAPSENGAEWLAAWAATPGLASLALDAQLRAPFDGANLDTLRKREALLVDLLKLRPGVSRAWLSLAALRNGLARPQDRVDAAFIMSGLTGPSEGVVMAERSLLGVLLWEKTSADVHARTMTDICGLTVFEPWKFRLIVTTKTDAVRADMRSGLEANGCAAALIKTVGL